MTKSFNCASCSAPLEFENKTMQKCGFCGSTVIVPSEMFYAADSGRVSDLSGLTGKALKITEILQLIRSGKKINAIKVFRETFDTGLKEAKDAVEAMERGEGVDISGMFGRVDKNSAEQIANKAGFSVLAIALFGIGVVVAGTALLMFLTYSLSENTRQSGPQSRPAQMTDATETLRIGGDGNGVGRFKDNRMVAVDGKGVIYSSDYSPVRVQTFAADGSFQNRMEAEQGTNLYGLAADRSGNIFIATNKGLYKYEGLTGKLLGKTANFYPRTMALSPDNKLFVSTGKTLVVFDIELKQIAEFKDAAEAAGATSGLEHIAVDGNGVIYATDTRNGDICKFSESGKFLDRFTGVSPSINAIAIDPKGRIFISSTNSIKVLDATGKVFKSIPEKQSFGIAFNAEGDLFVATRPYVVKYKLNF